MLYRPYHHWACADLRGYTALDGRAIKGARLNVIPYKYGPSQSQLKFRASKAYFK